MYIYKVYIVVSTVVVVVFQFIERFTFASLFSLVADLKRGHSV